MHLTDRGGLKYPSEPVLDSILVLWKRFYAIENNKELLAKLVSGPSRKMSVELTLMYLEDSDNHDTNIWNLIVFNCIQSEYLAETCFYRSESLSPNQVKNYHSVRMRRESYYFCCVLYFY